MGARGGGLSGVVKVNKIDPCALNTSLTIENRSDETKNLNHRDTSFSPSLRSQNRLCSEGGQVRAYENKHCIILLQSPASSPLKTI